MSDSVANCDNAVGLGMRLTMQPEIYWGCRKTFIISLGICAVYAAVAVARVTVIPWLRVRHLWRLKVIS